MVPGTTTEKELARFGVGDFFGENALIENKPRDAAVTAGTQRLNAAVIARLPHRNTPMRARTWCGLGLVRLSDAVADAVALLHGCMVGFGVLLCCSGGLVVPVH